MEVDLDTGGPYKRRVCLYVRNIKKFLAFINRAGGLYGRILTEVGSTDRTQ